MNNAHFPCAYTQRGDEKIQRAMLVAGLMADLLRDRDGMVAHPLNAESVAAVFECVHEQLNDAVSNNAFMSEALSPDEGGACDA
ncbi:hypothetical protein [Dickeya zeae]|uniref:hypothetical protein n=1 Tax=Dickeya zeae TaxID=204042 RepID=UPI00036B2F14|nr:hypothetical protein [Dickeya zeae]UJR55198.1 hypothetical protein J417_14770 [Dickeya zeae MS1]